MEARPEHREGGAVDNVVHGPAGHGQLPDGLLGEDRENVVLLKDPQESGPRQAQPVPRAEGGLAVQDGGGGAEGKAIPQKNGGGMVQLTDRVGIAGLGTGLAGEGGVLSRNAEAVAVPGVDQKAGQVPAVMNRLRVDVKLGLEKCQICHVRFSFAGRPRLGPRALNDCGDRDSPGPREGPDAPGRCPRISKSG